MVKLTAFSCKVVSSFVCWIRALGITQAKQKIARQTGIPTTKSGIERKIGKMILKSIFGK